MNVFKALLLREFWEHRGGLLITPAVIALIFSFFLVLGSVTGENIQINDNKIMLTEAAPHALSQLSELGEAEREGVMKIYLNWPLTVLGFVLMVVSLFYALGTLYDERKDRSILFWKSLPISDFATVLSKYVSIILVAPLIYFAVIAVFQLFLMVFATIIAWIGGGEASIMWSSINLFSNFWQTLVCLLLANLWLSPIWAWSMLASSWASRVAFLWGIIPIGVIFVAEAMLLSSSRLAEMFGDYVGRGFVLQNHYMQQVSRDAFDEIAYQGLVESFMSREFLVGAIVTVLLLAAAIYTRRFRDEA